MDLAQLADPGAASLSSPELSSADRRRQNNPRAYRLPPCISARLRILFWNEGNCFMR